MKFRYRKRRLRMHLIMAILWSVLGCITLLFSDKPSSFSYSYLPLGLLFFSIYVYDIKKGVLTYKSPIITQQTIPKKYFDLSKLDTIKIDIKGITLLSKTQKKLVIEPSIIKKNDLKKLKELLAKYEVKS